MLDAFRAFEMIKSTGYIDAFGILTTGLPRLSSSLSGGRGSWRSFISDGNPWTSTDPPSMWIESRPFPEKGTLSMWKYVPGEGMVGASHTSSHGSPGSKRSSVLMSWIGAADAHACGEQDAG